jgi:hypothetical protein
MVKTWLDDGDAATVREAVPMSSGLAVGLAAAFTLFVGVWPNWMLDASQHLTSFAP